MDDDIQSLDDLPPEVLMNIDHPPPTMTYWRAFDGGPTLREMSAEIIARLDRIERVLFTFHDEEHSSEL